MWTVLSFPNFSSSSCQEEKSSAKCLSTVYCESSIVPSNGGSYLVCSGVSILQKLIVSINADEAKIAPNMTNICFALGSWCFIKSLQGAEFEPHLFSKFGP